MFEELEGNDHQYDVDRVEKLKFSPLKGMNLLFLGSSVTIGFKSCEMSFPDYIQKRNDCRCVKEAISGTTLTDGDNSYIRRLKKVEKGQVWDFLICQLSTNDAYLKKNFGSLSESYNLNDFDQNTIYGAIEYIIAYGEKILGTKVLFYTSPYYENDHYRAMVDALKVVQKKWKIGVIDLYSDKGFNNLPDVTRTLYMGDPIHPTKAGYLLWITPVIEKYLYEYANR